MIGIYNKQNSTEIQYQIYFLPEMSDLQSMMVMNMSLNNLHAQIHCLNLMSKQRELKRSSVEWVQQNNKDLTINCWLQLVITSEISLNWGICVPWSRKNWRKNEFVCQDAKGFLESSLITSTRKSWGGNPRYFILLFA